MSGWFWDTGDGDGGSRGGNIYVPPPSNGGGGKKDEGGICGLIVFGFVAAAIVFTIVGAVRLMEVLT